MRLHRAWSQTHPGRCSLVLIGRDPTFVNEPVIEGAPNPLLGWCHPTWIQPMSLAGGEVLLERLGAKVGLRLTAAAAAHGRVWTGGHPLLLRQYGSAFRSVSPRWNGAADRLPEDALDEEFPTREAVTLMAREVVHLLRARFPAALDLLVATVHHEARDPGWELEIDRSGDAWRTLTNFGIVTMDSSWGAVPRYLSRYIEHFVDGASLRRVG